MTNTVFFYTDRKIRKNSVRESKMYLCTIYFAINTLAGIAVFLPAAAMRELQSSIMTRLPNAYDWITQQKRISKSNNTESIHQNPSHSLE